MPMLPRVVLPAGSSGWILIAILFAIALVGALELLVPRYGTNTPSAVSRASPNSQSMPSDLEEAPTLYWIDVLTVGSRVISFGGKTVPKIPRGTTLTVSGWVVDLRARQLDSAVYLAVDDNPPIAASYRLPRPDVARLFREAAWSEAGFRCEVPTTGLSAGMHSLNLIAINNRRTAYYYMSTNVRFLMR